MFPLVLNQRLRPSLAPGRGCAASLTEMRISKNLPPRPARRRVGLAHDQGPAMQRRDTSQPPCVSPCGKGSGPSPPGGHVSHCASAMATPARPRPSLGHDQRRRPGAQAFLCVIGRHEAHELLGRGSPWLHPISGQSQVWPSRPRSPQPHSPSPTHPTSLPLLPFSSPTAPPPPSPDSGTPGSRRSSTRPQQRPSTRPPCTPGQATHKCTSSHHSSTS